MLYSCYDTETISIIDCSYTPIIECELSAKSLCCVRDLELHVYIFCCCKTSDKKNNGRTQYNYFSLLLEMAWNMCMHANNKFRSIQDEIMRNLIHHMTE